MPTETATNQIPEPALEIIKRYQNLNLGEKNVVCPYYINVKRSRGELRALAGKGTPEEIEEETIIYAKLRGVKLEELSAEEIREFMQIEGIGIDCSGFLYHVYNAWLKHLNKGRIYMHIKYPKQSFLRQIVCKLRPAENIGARIMTNELNTDIISMQEVRTGDLLRLHTEKENHVSMIYSVVRNGNNEISQITYVHSTSAKYYGKQNGVKFGDIIITNPEGEIQDQEWTEVDENGNKRTYEKLMYNVKDNGLRRPRFLKLD